MLPLGINVIGCGPCGKLKTATGATVADLHRLQQKQQVGEVQGNPAGQWARIVVPMYVCLDCTIELKISDQECVNMLAGTEGDISLAEQHERELAETQQQEDPADVQP